MRLLVITLAACGSTAAPASAPAPLVTTKQPPPTAVSCGDAGVILRGTVQDTKKAGPAKEAAIASACLFDKWSRAVLDCVGSQIDSKACLDKLSEDQRAALTKKLNAWAEAYAESLITADAGDDLRFEEDVDCTAGVGDAATYSPALKVVGDELAFAVAMRKHELTTLCEATWSNSVKRCFDGGATADTCRSRLGADDQIAVTQRLAHVDGLLAKIVAAKQKPAATYDCKQVVASHYSDAAWKGKAEPRKNPRASRAELLKEANERKQMIADSRAAMQKACTTENWSATLRACELVGGGDSCSHGAGRDVRWGFPAAGVYVRSGIPECDAYAAVTYKLVACDKIPQSSRDGIRQAFEVERELWLKARPDQIGTFAAGCRQSEQTMRGAATSLSCPI